jgi:hypothetical protein
MLSKANQGTEGSKTKCTTVRAQAERVNFGDGAREERNEG